MIEFGYAAELRAEFGELSSGTVLVELDHDPQRPNVEIDALLARATARLADGPESGLAEIRAWRAAFARMGLRPTDYRCAAEALLRRLRKSGELPRIHPLVDACNAVSAAYAIPVAPFDLDRVTGPLQVRRASGEESYLAFSGERQHPEPGEVIFADAAGEAHARRWCHRQSGRSAIRPETRRVLIVVEAMHADGAVSVADALAELARIAPGRVVGGAERITR